MLCHLSGIHSGILFATFQANILTCYLAKNLTFHSGMCSGPCVCPDRSRARHGYLASILTLLHGAFFLACVSEISASLSGILSGIYLNILFGILSGIYPRHSIWTYSNIVSGIYSDILSTILSGIYSDILSRMCLGPCVPSLIWSLQQGSGPCVSRPSRSSLQALARTQCEAREVLI